MSKITNNIIIYFFLLLFITFAFSQSSFQKGEIKKGDTTITPIPRIGLDTTINVDGKTALFIGDSHTCNKNSGWQLLVCRETGMKMINPSVSGKTTYWMLNMAVYKMTDNIDYCFVYGGDCVTGRFVGGVIFFCLILGGTVLLHAGVSREFIWKR